MQSRKKDTSIYSGYISDWDSLQFTGGSFVGWFHLDCIDDLDDQKSITSYVFSLSYGPVTWDCKKQQALAISSAEVEYQAIVNSSQEALWL